MVVTPNDAQNLLPDQPTAVQDKVALSIREIESLRVIEIAGQVVSGGQNQLIPASGSATFRYCRARARSSCDWNGSEGTLKGTGVVMLGRADQHSVRSTGKKQLDFATQSLRKRPNCCITVIIAHCEVPAERYSPLRPRGIILSQHTSCFFGMMREA